jgi:hypothetical protein
VPVDDMADAAHPFMPSLRRQQDVQLRIVQRGKATMASGTPPPCA